MGLRRDLLFLFYKNLLRCYGLWPYQSKVSKRIACAAFSLLIFTLIFPLLAGLTDKWSTQRFVIVENVGTVVYLLVGWTQYIPLYFKDQKMRQLYETFVSKLDDFTDKAETKMLLSSIQKGLVFNSFIFFYTITAASITAIFGTFPTFQNKVSEEDHDKYYPYYYSGMIPHESFYYIFAFLHICVVFVPVALSYFITSFNYIICVCQVCGIHNIVCYRLLNLTNFQSSKEGSKLSKTEQDEKIISNIIDVVTKHKEALDELDLIKEAFSHSIFILQILGSIIISVLMYEILSDVNIYIEIAMILLLTITFNYSFSINWAGEQILKVSDDFFMTTYLIQWYELPKEAKRLLLFVRQKSHKVETVTIGSLWTLSFENFGGLMKACWSVATVLLTTQNKKSSN